MAPLDRLSRRSLPEEMADRLEAAVLAGDPSPDAPLREAALAERFGVSRGTVREALLLLERRGIVRRDAHRGSRVAAPSDADVAEILALRRIVEPGAVRILARSRRVPPELRELTEAMEPAAERGDWRGYGELDLRFHEGIVAAAGSVRLEAHFRRVLQELRLRLLVVDLGHPSGSVPAHVGEHAALLRTIEAGATEEALATIDGHLQDAERNLFGGSASA